IWGRGDRGARGGGPAVIDQHGATLLALGVLGALLERQRTGHGVHVEVSMLRAALDLQIESATYFLNGAALGKTNTPLASPFHPPPYGIYPTRDGHLMLSMSPLAQLADVLDLPALRGLVKPGWTSEPREAVARLLEPVIRTRTTAEWIDRLVPNGVWAAAVNDYAETFADPAVQAADAVEEISHPVAGAVKLLRFPLEFSTGRAGVRRPPPACGEHTDEILNALGYDASAIARLRKDGAV